MRQRWHKLINLNNISIMQYTNPFLVKSARCFKIVKHLSWSWVTNIVYSCTLKWKVTIYKLRSEVSLLEQPSIEYVFLANLKFISKFYKAMNSSPLLGPFGDSEFWEFSLLKIWTGWEILCFKLRGVIRISS